MTLLDIRTKITPILKQQGVTKAAVFGSTVTGVAKKTSDVDLLVEFAGRKSIFDLVGLKLDLEKFFTCSEYLSTAGSPNKKEIEKHELKRPKPPLLFHPTLSPEMVTPAVIDAAVNAGILELVTEQIWKKD